MSENNNQHMHCYTFIVTHTETSTIYIILFYRKIAFTNYFLLKGRIFTQYDAILNALKTDLHRSKTQFMYA